jgi:hypothetical protein
MIIAAIWGDKLAPSAIQKGAKEIFRTMGWLS